MRFLLRLVTRLFIVLLALTLGLAKAQTKEIKIGFSIENLKGERWQTDLDEFQARAHALGGAVVTRSADGDDDVQFRQVKELLEAASTFSFFCRTTPARPRGSSKQRTRSMCRS